MTDQIWTVRVVQDPNHPGELMLDLGHNLCDSLGWQAGDRVEWLDNKDGSWTLEKITTA